MTQRNLDDIFTESIRKVVSEKLKEHVAEENPQSQSTYQNDMLVEMARVDNPSKDNYLLGTKEIWIYSQDRSSITPHFHYFDKRNKPFSVEVRIEDLSICHSAPREGIPQNRLNSWEGLSNEYKVLKKWLNSNNNDMPSITNYEALKLAWNQNNRDNQVP